MTTIIPSLATLRSEIDEIDEQLRALLLQRARACAQVAEVKRDDGIPMMAPDRLAQVRSRARAFAEANDMEPDYLVDVFDLITMESCRAEDEVIGTDRAALATHGVRIDHVAVAVRDLEAAIDMLSSRFGFELVERRQVEGDFSGMVSATMQAGQAYFVLVQGLSPASNVSRYIEHYGPGVQHVAVSVRDQRGLHREFVRLGTDLLTGIIHAPGLDQSFTRRDPNTGLQLEFITRTGNEGFDDDNVRELFEAMEREDVY